MGTFKINAKLMSDLKKKKDLEDKEVISEASNTMANIAAVAGTTFVTTGSLDAALYAGGGAFLQKIFGLRGKFKQNRVIRFTDEFIKFIHIHEPDFDKEYMSSEDFSDFFEKLIINVSETKSTLKHNRFKNLLLNQISIKKNYDTSTRYLNLMTNLEEKQIVLLEHFGENESHDNDELSNIDKSNLNYSRKEIEDSIEHSELEFLLIDIRSKGLIKRKEGAIGATRPMSIFRHHSITQIGKEFLSYIKYHKTS